MTEKPDIKTLSESIISRAREGEDVISEMQDLVEAITSPSALSEDERALSMEAASWFVGQRAASVAVMMGESLLQLSRNLEALKFLRTICRREPFASYKPLLDLRDYVERGTQHSFSFADWAAVQAAVPMERENRTLAPYERDLINSIKAEAPLKLLSIFPGASSLEEVLLTEIPDLEIVVVELPRFDGRLAELSAKFPGRVLLSTCKGRYDFTEGTFDVCLLHRLETYPDLGATVAYAFDRAPALFTYALHASRWPPAGTVETGEGIRLFALHGLDPAETRLTFATLGLEPEVRDVDGILIAKCKLEAKDASAKPDDLRVGDPENSSQK